MVVSNIRGLLPSLLDWPAHLPPYVELDHSRAAALRKPWVPSHTEHRGRPMFSAAEPPAFSTRPTAHGPATRTCPRQSHPELRRRLCRAGGPVRAVAAAARSRRGPQDRRHHQGDAGADGHGAEPDIPPMQRAYGLSASARSRRVSCSRRSPSPSTPIGPSPASTSQSRDGGQRRLGRALHTLRDTVIPPIAATLPDTEVAVTGVTAGTTTSTRRCGRGSPTSSPSCSALRSSCCCSRSGHW